MENLGTFDVATISQNKYLKLDISNYEAGIHQIEDYFFLINSEKKVEWVVSRTCDHAHGKLVKKKCEHIAYCPLHDWTLNLNTLQYVNVQIKKDKKEFNQIDNVILIENPETFLNIPEKIKSNRASSIKIRFLSHACLALIFDNYTIITDPWLMGPCFMTGWWHKVLPKKDALEILKNADLIYISHNHPDHMHAETLAYLKDVKPQIEIIVPAFSTNSVIRPLEKMGFKNVKPLLFNHIYSVNKNIVISILKSGDFRDDSGLFFNSGNFSGLITVDSAALNKMVLPKDIDFLATSFAGGASGYPWCFEHYSLTEREEISNKSKKATLKLALDYVRTVNPKAYMPYAGYFTEAAERDSFINKNNVKNCIKDVRDRLARMAPEIVFIDPTSTDQVHFLLDGNIVLEKINLNSLYDLNEKYVSKYIEIETKSAENFDLEKIKKYFLSCGFQDDLIVYVLLTDDNFFPIEKGFKIDFCHTKTKVEILNCVELEIDYNQDSIHRKKLMKIRKNALWSVIEKKLSWEELSIGFQCRIMRRPEIYNSQFWYHFTNIYTEV